MAWGRIDDAFDDHPKVLALLDMEGAAGAIGLWTLCFTWAHRNTRKKGKTPGLIPASLPRRFFGPEARNLAALLVEVGLWDEAPGDGWLIHDFADYLPGKEVSEARSAAGKRGAAKRWGGKEPSADDNAMAGQKQADGKPMAPPKQTDGNLPSGDGSEPSDDGKAVASDSSRAGAPREWAWVGSSGSDRTSVSLRQDQPPPSAAAASGDDETELGPGEEGGQLFDLDAQREKQAECGSDQDPHFVAFWEAYPRKVGKPSARRAWVKAVRKARADPAVIMAAAEKFRDDPTRRRRDIEFTPHPATWLNDARYDDNPARDEDQSHPAWDDVDEHAPWEFNP